MLKQLCICDQCGHVWVVKEVPERCANCHKRTWNGKKSTSAEGEVVTKVPPQLETAEGTIGPEDGDWPKPVAELEDTGEPYKRSETKAKKPDLSVPKYCRHGLAFHPGCQ